MIVIRLVPIMLTYYRDKKEKKFFLNEDVVESFAAGINEWLKRGRKFCVTETFRSITKQRELKKLKPTLACAPGWSLHGHGRAVDFDTRSIGGEKELLEFYEHMSRYGWYTIYNAPGKPIIYRSREAWHLQRTEPPGMPSREYLKKLAKEHGGENSLLKLKYEFVK